MQKNKILKKSDFSTSMLLWIKFLNFKIHRNCKLQTIKEEIQKAS